MAMVKGMLMQSKGKQGIVMTSTGEFVKVILPNGHVRLGEEIEAVRYRQKTSFKYIVVAAALFLMVLLIPGYQHFYPKEAMAYVALDINPSIELAVNKELKISAVEGLNSDGKKIAAEVDVIGMQLYQALPLLVEQAITDGYLEPGRENVVLSTVTVNEDKETIKIEEHKIQQAINKPIQNNQMAAKVVVEQSATADREQAKKAGLSTGKYLLYKEAQKSGLNLTMEEIRNQGIYQLEQQKQVKIEQLLLKQRSDKNWEKQLPPGQGKKLQRLLDKATQQGQTITPEQREKLVEGLQPVLTEPGKDQQRLNKTNSWKKKSDERVTRDIQTERKRIEKIKEKKANHNAMQKRQPGLEKKQFLRDTAKGLPPGIEKKLQQKQPDHSRVEKSDNDNKQKQRLKNNDD
ncbi:anti-sigma factor domain-containing protein [Peptococcaceae bacterium 1198_IL3148]